MFYAQSTGGFYSVDLHGENIPTDAVEISLEQHEALLIGQSSGQRIVADASGFPVLQDKPAPTVEQIVAQYESALQAAIDAGAKSWGYDDIKSAVGYVGDPFPRFNAEAVALRNWRSAVWVWAGVEEAAIKAGSKSLPTPVEAFVAQMPALPERPVV